jgi:hypothetical protein
MGDYKYSNYSRAQLIEVIKTLQAKKRSESTLVGRDGIIKELRVVSRILEQRK